MLISEKDKYIQIVRGIINDPHVQHVLNLLKAYRAEEIESLVKAPDQQMTEQKRGVVLFIDNLFLDLTRVQKTRIFKNGAYTGE